MELQEFIKNTLVDITNGIVEAQKELKDTGCLVNPLGDDKNNYIENDARDGCRFIQKVKMNIVLNITKGTKAKSGIGVAQVIKAGIDTEKSNTNNEVTSIQFEIPISFPVMK